MNSLRSLLSNIKHKFSSPKVDRLQKYFHGVAITDRGCQRSNNEDAVALVLPNHPTALAVVADGMGGHLAGEVASQTTVSMLENHFESGDLKDLTSLVAACDQANEAVWIDSMSDPTIQGMGTTCSALFLKDRM